MKPSDSLFQLIKSLSQNEKRYIRLFSSLSNKKGDSSYLKLFDVIDRIKENEYDENSLKKKLARTTFNSLHLHAAKNYLQELILKSLRNFYADNTDEDHLENMLKDARLLLQKGLHSQAKKILDRAEKLATETENFNDLLKVLNLQMKLYSNPLVNTKIRKENIFRINQKSELVISKIKNLQDYRSLWYEFNNLNKKIDPGFKARDPDTLNSIDTFFKNPLCSDETLAQSNSSKKLFYGLRFAYYGCKGDVLLAYEWINKQIIHLEKNTYLITRHFADYFYTINIFIEKCLLLKKDEEIINALNKMKALPDLFPKLITLLLKEEIIIYSLAHELNYFLSKNMFSKAKQAIELNSKDYAKFITVCSKTRSKLTTDYFIAYIYFVEGDYKKSLHWINLIINNVDAPITPSISCYVRMLSCMVYYELGYVELFDSSVKSTHHFITKNQRFLSFEKIVLNAFQQLMKGNTEKEVQIFESLKNEVESLEDQQAVPLEYLNLVAWANSKLLKISFEDALLIKE